MESITLLISEGFTIPEPNVAAVFLPAIVAPRNTIRPNNPGIRLLRITLAPYAAEKEGAVPLPPILKARNIPRIKGTNICE